MSTTRRRAASAATSSERRSTRFGHGTAATVPAQLEDKSLVADPTTDAVAWDHEWSLSVLNRALREVATRFEAATFAAFELYGRRGVFGEGVGRANRAVR